MIITMLNKMTTKEGWSPKKVAVLKGGWSGEREVSLTSAQGVVAALESRGFQVFDIDVTENILELVTTLTQFNPDVVFMNAIHGRYAEDGHLQGLIELLGYPYTGSNVQASALAMDKSKSRDLFEQRGLPIPKGFKTTTSFFETAETSLAYPFVIKPTNEGSSLGVFIIDTLQDLKKAQEMWQYGNELLVEAYIPGRELSVAIMNGKALGVLELRPTRGFYDYEAKYTGGITEHVMPADIPEVDYQLALELAEEAAKVLGASGISRVDMRYDDYAPEGKRHYLLELNTLPGMTPLSIVPDIARYVGLSYEDLCEWMVKNPLWPEIKEVASNPLQETTGTPSVGQKPAVL